MGEVVRLFPVLAAVWPTSEASAEGLEPAERRERAVSGLRERICEALTTGFLSHDGLVSIHFNILWRRLAIELGDRRSTMRALSVDMAFCSTAGWLEQVSDLLARSTVLAGDDSRMRAWLAAMQIHVHMNYGEFRRTIELLDANLPRLEAHADARWERRMAIVGALGAQVMGGRYRNAIAIARRDLQLGVELGDTKQARDSVGMLAWALVCAGELDEAGQVIAEVEELERGIVDGRYLFADLFRDLARIRWSLRTRAANQALADARQLPAKMKRDGLWHVASFRLETLSVIACAELQVWLRAPSRGGRRRLQSLARQLAKGSVYQRGNAAIIQATLCEVGGDPQPAQAKFAEAERCFASVGADAHLAAVQLRRAASCGDVEAQRLRAAAQAYFEREGIREPEGLVMVFAPRLP